MEDYGAANVAGCSRVGKGCAVILGLLVVLFVSCMVYVIRLPGFQSTLKCQNNMKEIGAAILRYHDVNGVYPSDLGQLRKDYLKDPSVLRCPLDKANSSSSYVYTQPGPDAKDDFVILECDRHRLNKSMPYSKMLVLKNGTLKMNKPDFKEIMKESEKQK